MGLLVRASCLGNREFALTGPLPQERGNNSPMAWHVKAQNVFAR